MFKNYDVIVVGAGHAGCEAAAAAANLGSSVLLVTMNMQTIAQMSCNPAMGGIAKGQIVREIDALGGYSGIVSDKTAIQFRMLNRSKGPAMWSPRVQSDRQRFAEEWRLMLEQTPNVDFWQDMVKEIIVDEGVIKGIVTGMGLKIYSKAVVLTNGTFLNGIIHIGEKQFGGGRASESASKGITEQLVALGFESGRMKTGTPPRIDGRSLDYSKMEEQKGDENPGKFSFLKDTSPFIPHSGVDIPSLSGGIGSPLSGGEGSGERKEQRSCHISYTNETVHEILRTGFEKSPMFQGRIKGLGPRYCPSIEDKITRFAERERHQLFVEPEGWNTVEVYINGFSTSLPEEVQYKALKLIPGFENVRMFRPGYAIEYDYFPPHQLRLSLETKLISNLFFAGQINGTTGYEEAACQGLMAGINAHLKVYEKAAFVLQRSEAYIGVLIDDLVTKGTNEPYRMFTSRAEYRILLRQDNADIRLTPKSFELGLASKERMKRVGVKMKTVKEISEYFKRISADPHLVNPYLETLQSAPINQKIKYFTILSRPNVSIVGLLTCDETLKNFITNYDEESIEQAEILMKYEGYIEKEQEMVDKQSRLENLELNHIFDYKTIPSLSSEAKDKLNKVKPKTIGQASRISGISPADISVLMIYMGR